MAVGDPMTPPEGVEPPYWAVIFTAQLRDAAEGGASEDYGAVAARLEALATDQPGYLGIESARGADGLGVTVSYWREREDFERWRDQVDHAAARERGRSSWYSSYELRFARVERAVSWRAPDAD